MTHIQNSKESRQTGADDKAIRSTATNALETKIATVHAGYYDDPILALLPPPSRLVQPMIKRGTYARMYCVDRAIKVFCDLFPQRQIIVIGSGLDSPFFRCTDSLGDEQKTVWIEIDHPQVISQKISMLQKLGGLRNTPSFTISRSVATGCQAIHHSVNSEGLQKLSLLNYLIDFDLRGDLSLLQKNISQTPSFNHSHPTLIVSECVQMYLPVEASSRLLKLFTSFLPRLYFVSYEPVLKADPFGRVMESNLKAASMIDDESCLTRLRTMHDLLNHFKSIGCEQGVACDMWAAYESVLSNDDRQKANRCEFLDEVEEWIMIMQHYCFLVARSDRSCEGEEFCSVGPRSHVGFNETKSERFS